MTTVPTMPQTSTPEASPQSTPTSSRPGNEDFPDLAPTDGSDQNEDRAVSDYRSFEEILGGPDESQVPPTISEPTPVQRTQEEVGQQQQIEQPPVEQPPVVQTQPEVAQQPTPPEQQQQPGQPQQAVDPQQQPQQPAATPPRPEHSLANLAAQIAQHKPQLIEQTAAQYASGFTEDQVNEMHSDPKKFFSNFAAQMQVDALERAMQVVSSQIPTTVMGLIQTSQQQNRYEDQFYQAWPQLKDEKYSQTIAQIATTYRQQNPQVSTEDAIRNVGAIAMMSLGIQQQAPAQQQQQRAAPQQQRRTPPNFTPAQAGQVSPVPNGQVTNPWTAYTNQMMAEDRE